MSALTQALRIAFEAELVAVQLPPYGFKSTVSPGDRVGRRAALAKLPASAFQKLLALFLVPNVPALREPHKYFVAGRESLASLDSAAPNQRLAFLLRVERDRVALFDQEIAPDKPVKPDSCRSGRARERSASVSQEDAGACGPPWIPRAGRAGLAIRSAMAGADQLRHASYPRDPSRRPYGDGISAYAGDPEAAPGTGGGCLPGTFRINPVGRAPVRRSFCCGP